MDAFTVSHSLKAVIKPRYKLVAGHQYLGDIVRVGITNITKVLLANIR
mgnify:FL=1